MSGRRVLVYYSWSRSEEADAPLPVIEDRFPTLFEIRRWNYPQFVDFSDPSQFDQGIAGFLDHVLKENFHLFIDQARARTGHEVSWVERVGAEHGLTPIDAALLRDIDTIIVISFDSLRTNQRPAPDEIPALKSFLDDPDNLLFVCPHHDIGETGDLADPDRLELRTEQFLHHGDRSIPPRQQFGGFARSLLSALGVPVRNRFGLRPRRLPDGSPAPVVVDRDRDRLGLLAGVTSLNLHPHLPHLERLEGALNRLEVLVRQPIDLSAPPHAFTRDGRDTFDAMLQSREGVFAGALLVCDATLWSGNAGGIENLQRFWANVVQRPVRTSAPALP